MKISIYVEGMIFLYKISIFSKKGSFRISKAMVSICDTA